jgi:hypothetical protein
MPENSIRRVDEHDGDAEYRSATTNALLGIGAANAVVPLVAPYVHDGIGKLTGPRDDGPQVMIAPGTRRPEKD